MDQRLDGASQNLPIRNDISQMDARFRLFQERHDRRLKLIEDQLSVNKAQILQLTQKIKNLRDRMDRYDSSNRRKWWVQVIIGTALGVHAAGLFDSIASSMLAESVETIDSLADVENFVTYIDAVDDRASIVESLLSPNIIETLSSFVDSCFAEDSPNSERLVLEQHQEVSEVQDQPSLITTDSQVDNLDSNQVLKFNFLLLIEAMPCPEL